MSGAVNGGAAERGRDRTPGLSRGLSRGGTAGDGWPGGAGAARRAARPAARPAAPPAARAARAALLAALLASLIAAAAAGPAAAQDLSLLPGGGPAGLPGLSGEGSLAGQAVFLFVALSVLSLAPGIAIMVTCFPFILTVLSILRQAIGLPQAPPNMLLVSLSLFLTWYIMEPVFTEAWQAGVAPFAAGEIAPAEAFDRAAAPFRAFMAARADAATLAELAAARGTPEAAAGPGDPPLSLVVPAFLLSEITRAFQIGFALFLPFLVIDLVVSAVLMAMGMMMVPPAIVSLPFKLAFFVVADGWTLVASALVRGYG